VTDPDESLGTEQPVEDVLEQRQEVTAVRPDLDPGLPAEADPADVADQRRALGGPDDLDEEDREYG
jgi:hypothetical protein